MIEQFNEYLMNIAKEEYREKITHVLEKLHCKYPELTPKISWGMPVFTLNQTYILGLSAAKEHFSIAPEPIAIEKFAKEIKEAGYKSTKGLFKIKWMAEVNYDLIYKIIDFNIADKVKCKTFWRQERKEN